MLPSPGKRHDYNSDNMINNNTTTIIKNEGANGVVGNVLEMSDNNTSYTTIEVHTPCTTSHVYNVVL